MNSNNAKHLFTLLDTPVTAEPSALVTPLSVLGLGTWASGLVDPARSWLARWGYGFLALAAYLMADVAHAIGHILSARFAQAPMDEFYLAAPLPRTLYYDDNVSPDAHRLRAIGGPLASVLALLVSLVMWPLTRPGSVLRELAMLSGLANGLIGLGSLTPFPFFDGGVLLRWTLVDQGYEPGAADQIVQRTNVALGGFAAGVGLVLALRRSWLAAVGCFLGAALAIGVALGKIKK